MARRSKPQARRQGSGATPAWAWLLIGLFIGALGYFGYQQYRAMSSPQPDTLPLPGAKMKDSEPGRSSEPPASGMDDGVLDTDYSFYDVLPTQETVDVPEPEDTATAAEQSAKNPADGTVTPVAGAPAGNSTEPSATQPAADKTPAVDASRYLLQAGSFERSADADDLKARIALSGEPAHVETAEVNGKTMYRVRLGPYADASAANTAKANLAGQGINAVRIKIK